MLQKAMAKHKSVRFTLPPVVIHDPEDMFYELLEYRRDIALHRKADAARLERILSPILCLDHRHKIWSKLHSA
jgi:hypothetical protein